MKKIIRPITFLLICFYGSVAGHSQIITTIAGTGDPGYSTGGGIATAAQLNDPTGVAVDTSGNIYIADGINNMIRKVTPYGIISTIAGTGVAGYSTGGGIATAAMFSYPFGIALDKFGNIYIGDAYNYRVRKITPSGEIQTIAGNGTDITTGLGGPATAAGLNTARGVAVDDSGNVFISDGHDIILKVNTAGIISKYAGGVLVPLGDGGPATSAGINSPDGLTFDNTGNLLIGDVDDYRVRRINAAGVITTIAGNGVDSSGGDGGPATAAHINGPSGIAIDRTGNMFITEAINNYIRKVNPAGIITTICGTGDFAYSGDGGPATAAAIANPHGICVDRMGNVYITDDANNRVRKIIKCLQAPYPIVGGPHTCVGDSIILSSIETGGYWTSSNPAVAIIDSTTGILKGIDTGTVIITYKTTTLCGTDVATKTITISSCTESVSVVNKEPIEIFPNPSTGVVYIRSSELLNAIIYSVDGRQVIEQADVKDINMSKLSTGIYTLMLYNGYGLLQKVEKLVKQ